VGINIHHVTQYVRPLVAEELLRERTSHIHQGKRRRKVYFLTPRGRNLAASLRTTVLKEEVPFRARGGDVREVSLTEICQEHRRGTQVSQLLLELKTLGFVPEEPGEEEPGIVDFAREAPTAESFYGREAEVSQAIKAVDRAGLVVITGMAGIGKTALGSKVCDTLRGKRSLFWRQIRPWDGPMDLALRLAHFLNSLGRVGVHSALLSSGPKALSQIEGLLKEDLAGIDALLVFDDVHDASEDTASFLALLLQALKEQRGTSTLLLSRDPPTFYSRREVAIEGAVAELPLGRLDRESSHAILREAGVPDALIGPFIKAAGGNPLFLRLLSKASIHGAPRVQTLEVYIAEEIEPRLSRPERKCLEAASLYQVPVPNQGLLLERGVRTSVLVSLERKGLLEHVDPDRLVLHDTLRSYFGRGLSQERLEDLTEKIVPWLQTAAEAQAEQGSPEEGIVFVQNAVAVDSNRSRLVPSLELLGRLRKFVGDSPGAIEAYRTALRHATEGEVQARLHRKIALSHANQGNFEDAEREIDAGLALLPAGPSLEAAWMNQQRASNAVNRGDYDRCLQTVERVLGWLNQLPEEPNLYGFLLNNRALVHMYDMRREDFPLAQADLEEAEVAFKAAGNPRGLANVFNNMAINAVNRHRVEEAPGYLDQGMDVAVNAGDSALQAALLFTKASLLTQAGDYETAEEALQESYRRNKETHQGQKVIWHYWYFAEIYRHTERPEEARESLDYFLQSSRDLTDREFRAQTLGTMVRLCVLTGDLDSAESHFEEVWKIVEEVHSEPAEMAAHWANGALLASRGDVNGAQEAFQRARELAPPDEQGELSLEFGRFLASSGERDRAREVLLEASGDPGNSSAALRQAIEEELTALSAEV
ncbi:MAG: AAA family ATPase, partial [Thermoplasmata archaeon]